MNADQDRTLKIVIQTLHDWWASAGELAWLLLGVLLVGQYRNYDRAAALDLGRRFVATDRIWISPPASNR